MRPDAGPGADLVDLREQFDTPSVPRDGVGRVMIGNQQGALILLCLGALQRRLEKSKLGLPDMLGVGDHPGIFQRIAVQHENPDKRRIQREKHTRLDLRGARQAAGIRCDHEAFGAEVAQIGRKAGCMRFGRDHAVMVAGAREDRRGVFAIRLVKLIVVVRAFAEVVDHVTEHQHELRHFLGIRFDEVRGHLVGHFVLRGRSLGAAAIAGGVKDDLAALHDLPGRVGVAAQHLGERQLRLGPAARRRKRQWKQLVFRIEFVDFLIDVVVGRMSNAKDRRIRGGFRLRENGALQDARCERHSGRGGGCRCGIGGRGRAGCRGGRFAAGFCSGRFRFCFDGHAKTPMT
jgi:hypothetical protein